MYNTINKVRYSEGKKDKNVFLFTCRRVAIDYTSLTLKQKAKPCCSALDQALSWTVPPSTAPFRGSHRAPLTVGVTICWHTIWLTFTWV